MKKEAIIRIIVAAFFFFMAAAISGCGYRLRVVKVKTLPTAKQKTSAVANKIEKAPIIREAKTEAVPVSRKMDQGPTANIPVTRKIQYKTFRSQDKPSPSIAGKLCWDGHKWRRQIMLYNGARKSMVTPKMIKYVMALTPYRRGEYKWENFEYLLFDSEYYTADTTTPVARTVVAKKPTAAAQAIIKPAPTPLAAKPAKAPPVNSKLATLKKAEAKIKNLGYENVKEFQKAWHIKADGIIGPMTINMIRIAEKLNAKYAPIITDKLGWSSVEEFQANFNLKPRGSVDQETVEKVMVIEDEIKKAAYEKVKPVEPEPLKAEPPEGAAEKSKE